MSDEPLSPLGPRPAQPFDAPAAAERPPEAPALRFDGPVLPPPPAEPATAPREPYPMHFSVAYPGKLSRLSTLLRLFLLVPAWMLGTFFYFAAYGAFPIGWLAVFFRKSYPTWLFHGVTGGLAWAARTQAYGALLTDKFPSLDAEGSRVRLTYDQPERGGLSRWRVLLWKWVLTAPHLFLLGFLGFALFVVTILAWFAILFTGRYPRGLFGFATGVLRWHYRVSGYFLSLNDRFPPFSLAAEAGPASRGATIASGLIGLLLVGGWAGLLGASVAAGTGQQADVNYDSLERGVADAPRFFLGPREDPSFVVALLRVTDPSPDVQRALAVGSASRVVVFEFTYFNLTTRDRTVRSEDFRLAYSFSEEGGEPSKKTREASIVQLGGALSPAAVKRDATVTVRVAFTIPADATPARLTVDPPWDTTGTLKYDFR
ncbi:MAG: DUF4389 domain-containing protein [Dehalococcoidia bacterium]